VPGCRNAIFVDLHHREWSLDGGGSVVANLVILCAAHHRAVHLGKLFVESTPAGLRFFHADGTIYGSSLCPATDGARARAEGAHALAMTTGKADGARASVMNEARGKAERALKVMGFAAKDVKLALARIPQNSNASLEQIIRQGLAELG
jgi:hypothetical protein